MYVPRKLRTTNTCYKLKWMFDVAQDVVEESE